MDPRSEISVVIPVFNGEAHIERTLDSVMQQTVLPLEVLVVDDGSTDKTRDVIEAYAIAHPNLCLTLISSPHAGPGGARNQGIERARGEWIAFLDSDDLWLPEKLVQVARCHDISTYANFFCHNERHLHLDGIETLLDYSKGFCETDSLCTQLYWRNRFSTSAVVCRRQLLIDAGLFDTSLRSCQDYELWLRMSPMISVCFVRQTLGIYVDRLGNITSSGHWHRYRNLLIVLNRHRGFVSPTTYLKTITRLSISYLYSWAVRTPTVWVRLRKSNKRRRAEWVRNDGLR